MVSSILPALTDMESHVVTGYTMPTQGRSWGHHFRNSDGGRFQLQPHTSRLTYGGAGNSLAIQWLGLHTFTTKDQGSRFCRPSGASKKKFKKIPQGRRWLAKDTQEISNLIKPWSDETVIINKVLSVEWHEGTNEQRKPDFGRNGAGLLPIEKPPKHDISEDSWFSWGFTWQRIMTWVTLDLASLLSPLSSPVRTERTKSPGWLWLSRTRKLPCFPFSVNNFSASFPERCPWNHLIFFLNDNQLSSAMSSQHPFIKLPSIVISQNNLK